MRGTIPAGHSQGVHLLAAYWPEEGWVLFQVEVGNKENEIPAAVRLVKTLDLRGKIVTGDACWPSARCHWRLPKRVAIMCGSSKIINRRRMRISSGCLPRSRW